MTRQKILVEIIGENGVKSKKKYPIEADKVVIDPGKRGRGNPPYKPSFNKDCILPYYTGFGPFKRLKQKLLLIDGASKCVSFEFNNGKGIVDMPLWDRPTEEKLFDASVIKAAGATTQKVKISPLLYIALFMVVGMQFLTILLLTGKVRVG